MAVPLYHTMGGCRQCCAIITYHGWLQIVMCHYNIIMGGCRYNCRITTHHGWLQIWLCYYNIAWVVADMAVPCHASHMYGHVDALCIIFMFMKYIYVGQSQCEYCVYAQCGHIDDCIDSLRKSFDGFCHTIMDNQLGDN